MELTFHDLTDAEHVEHTQHRTEAAAFFGSDDFVLFCDWLGWDAEAVRAALLHVNGEKTQEAAP